MGPAFDLEGQHEKCWTLHMVERLNRSQIVEQRYAKYLTDQVSGPWHMCVWLPVAISSNVDSDWMGNTKQEIQTMFGQHGKFKLSAPRTPQIPNATHPLQTHCLHEEVAHPALLDHVVIDVV
jgi:hypothetical protein